MLLSTPIIIATTSLICLTIADPVPIANTEVDIRTEPYLNLLDIVKRDGTHAPDERLEIHCNYGQQCYCQRTKVRFTCQQIDGCDLACPTGPIIPKAA